MQEQNPVGWFEIYVDDIDRAQKFYEMVFDVKLGDLPDPSGSGIVMRPFPMYPDKPNSAGTLVKMEGMKAGGNSTVVYFVSEDCSIESSRVEKAGGKVFQPKMSIGEFGFVSLCYDTEGNMIGIHSMA
ncbi:MAG: VOC family protein [Chitinophagaceae bacterium]|nr:MAG: VOC family protein [Chitinophagaceae bacterium]